MEVADKQIVVATAKVTFFEQITTDKSISNIENKLLLLLQR